jgi:hypothetical protein
MVRLRTVVGLTLWLAGLGLAAQSVHAATIFQNGPFPCTNSVCHGYALGDINPGASDASYEWMANRFSVDHQTHITSLEAWLRPWIPTEIVGSLTFAIYGSAAGDLVPNPALEYFAGEVSIVDHPGELHGTYGDQWQGLTGLDVLLQPGTYWLSLENRAGDVYQGSVGTSGVVQPVDTGWAFYRPENGGRWSDTAADGWGVRIQGLPEPATTSLVSFALLLFAVRSRSCSRRGQ